MDRLKHGDMTLTWLPTSISITDGGPIFGVVNKKEWTNYYPANENYDIELHQSPILIQYRDKNYLIDVGYDTSKFTDLKRRTSDIVSETLIDESLAQVGLTPADIDAILITHMHDGHASGLTRKNEAGDFVPVFPNALIYISDLEWGEVTHPNIRSKGLYMQETWEPVIGKVRVFTDGIIVAPGIEMIHIGGHSRGMCMVKLTQGQEVAIHLSDLLYTVAAMNPLWITAFDDYPMEGIRIKQKWLNEAFSKGYKFIFYHDAYYCMLQFDSDGRKIIDSLERSGPHIIPWPETIAKPTDGM